MKPAAPVTKHTAIPEVYAASETAGKSLVQD